MAQKRLTSGGGGGGGASSAPSPAEPLWTPSTTFWKNAPGCVGASSSSGS